MTSAPPQVLHATSAESTAAAALADFVSTHKAGEAVGFVCDPFATYWIRYTDGHWTAFDEAEPDLDAAFGITAFTEGRQLRWRHTQHGRGVAALTLESSGGNDSAEQPTRLGHDPQIRMIWGTSTGSTRDGWSELADPRTGPFWVPFSALPKDSRLGFRVLEYVTTDEHGNVAVVDERICGLTQIPPHAKEGK